MIFRAFRGAVCLLSAVTLLSSAALADEKSNKFDDKILSELKAMDRTQREAIMDVASSCYRLDVYSASDCHLMSQKWLARTETENPPKNTYVSVLVTFGMSKQLLDQNEQYKRTVLMVGKENAGAKALAATMENTAMEANRYSQAIAEAYRKLR